MRQSYPAFHIFVVLLALSIVQGSSISLASWNIQDFGVTKAGRTAVMKMITKIISRYDVLFLQELSQAPNSECGVNTGSVICSLVSDLNQASSTMKYALSVSPRVGDGSPEQYATIYNKNKLRLLDSFLYGDSDHSFVRPPFVVQLALSSDTSGSTAFYVANVHVSPSVAREEVLSYADVGTYIMGKSTPGSQRVFLLGDLNADCDYFNPKTGWPLFFKRLPGTWSLLIGDHAQTSVRSNCSYDRIISSPELTKLIDVSSAQPFYFDDTSKGGFSMADIIKQGCADGYITHDCPNGVTREAAALKVSDHYPVQVKLNLGSRERASLN